MKEKIVITGTGVITALGCDTVSMWDSLLKGKSAVKRIEFPDVEMEQYGSKVAAYIDDFNIRNFIENDKSLKRNGRVTNFGLACSKVAIDNAGYKFNTRKNDLGKIIYDINGEDLSRWGVILGVGVQNMDICEKFHKSLVLNNGPKKISPFALPFIPVNIIPAIVSEKFGITGPSFTVSTACASATHGLLTALSLLQNGLIDVAVTGGVEACITSYVMGGFDAMFALSRNNDDVQNACRPFDKNRDGFILGEGAGVIILETESHAKKRGANILAELAGGVMTSDAYHVTAPNPQGTSSIMMLERTLENAGVTKDEVDYINAHGTSTPLNDPTESFIIKQVFGERAYKIPVSSTKSMLGHSIGASGGIEAVVLVQTILNNIIHQTLNLKEPDINYIDDKYPHLDKRCDLDYVMDQPREKRVDVAVSQSFGFGGHDSAIVIKRY